MNKRLDDILESEKDDTFGSEAVMEGEEELPAEGSDEDVYGGDDGVQEPPQEEAVPEDAYEEEAGIEVRDVQYAEGERFGEEDVGEEEVNINEI